MNEPSMGHIVRYASRTGNYECAAIITATKGDLHQPNVDAGYIEGLSSDGHVHLTVFTPGKPGKRATADDFVGDRADAPISENVSGTYQEWDVPLDESGAPGTWRWPARVGGDAPVPNVGGIVTGNVPSASNDIGDEQPLAKRAIESFPLDNGTIAEGQVLPAGHPAVERHPELFVDVVVAEDVPDGQAISDLNTGTAIEAPKDDAPAEPAPEVPVLTDGDTEVAVAAGDTTGVPAAEVTGQPGGDPVGPTLYRHVGDGPVDETTWPESGDVNADGEKLYRFAFEMAPGDGASDAWVVDTDTAPK